MRWVRQWLKAFFLCLGILFIFYTHLYFVFAVASAINDVDCLTAFSQREGNIFIGSVLVSLVASTWLTLRARNRGN